MEKIIHQIWIGPYEMPNVEKFFVNKVKEMNPDFKHILWTEENRPKLPDYLEDKCKFWREDPVYGESYAAEADILRIYLVREYGGIYLDADWESHKSLSELNLGDKDGFIVYHNEYTSGNEIFGCKSKSGFIEEMYKSLFQTPVSHPHFPHWFNDELRKYFNVPNTWNKENFTDEEFERYGKEWLNNMKDNNVLPLKKHGEFEHIFMTHNILFSHDYKHREYFKAGNVNYQETVYNIKVDGYNK